MNSPVTHRPPDKLTMLDEHGAKIRIYPAEVRGFFRKWRIVTQFVLMLIFLFLPWVKINGHQALLFDIPGRRFAIFGLTFWAHDGPLILFVAGIAIFGLVFATALWGRIWCGWACPQTVFIDGVFLRIERWIEGTHLERRKLDQAPLTFKKLFKKTSKWILFFFAGGMIAHSFLAYFVGTERLLEMMQSDPRQNLWPFVFVFVVTAILVVNFAWFREQFCIIVCPYGRFQSTLQDRHTITVMYDQQRGEPRRGLPAVDGKQGDCVGCQRCVQVCPTGIDIRQGIQMECIACTACVDACDDIMKKVNKETGLIRYASLSGQSLRIWRFRVLLPAFFVLVSVLGLAFSAGERKSLKMFVLRGKETPYTLAKVEGEDRVINHFRVHVQNQSFENLPVELILLQAQELHLQMMTPETKWILPPGEFKMVHLFVEAPQSEFKGGRLKTKIQVKTPTQNFEEEIQLVGPDTTSAH